MSTRSRLRVQSAHPARTSTHHAESHRKRPEDRYQTAEEFIADLRALSFHFSELDDTRHAELTSYASGSYITNAHRATSLTTLSDNLRRPASPSPPLIVRVARAHGRCVGRERLRAPDAAHKPSDQAQANTMWARICCARARTIKRARTCVMPRNSTTNSCWPTRAWPKLYRTGQRRQRGDSMLRAESPTR